MEMDVIQMVVQGGAVGVAVYITFVLQKVVTNHHAHTDAVIERNTEASAKASAMHEALAKSIERMSEIIEKKL
jgi:hypothetical protein